MNTTDKIIKLMENKNISASNLTKILELSPSAITEWKKGKAKPSAEALTKLADYFDVSVDYLLGRTEKKEAQPNRVTPLFSDIEIEIIEIYRQCPPETKMVIESMIFSLKKETAAKIG